ncbi:MAG: transcriptional regulator [Anaerorhabdus sp.]
MKEVKKIKLTDIDRIILNSHRSVMVGLADFLGRGCEILLNSLEDFDNSIINIINGHLSGRRIGDPITDMALSMLVKVESEHLNGYISYEAVSKKGAPLRCSTLVIYGENHRPIGLLCINFYMNTPASDIFPLFKILNQPMDAPIRNDAFADDVEKVLQTMYDQAYLVVSRDESIPASLRNKEIITILYNQGLFNMKDSVIQLAQVMGVSKNTVYMHLRSIKGKEVV